MSKLSVLILARNEAHNIRDCINSCRFADEILLIDDYSQDDTAHIAAECGAKIIQRAMNGDWGAQQSFAIGQAAHEWIFFIDADERCSPELAEEIQSVVAKNEAAAYWIQRHNRFQHHQARHGILRPDFVCRLMPAEGSRVEGYVHPKIIHPYENRRLQQPMYHYTYDNWQQYFNKFNHYTTLAAEKYRAKGKSVGFIKDIILRPFWAFFKVYFINRGFLDGKLGWIFAVNHYFYTMNKYVKLYYLYQSKGKL